MPARPIKPPRLISALMVFLFFGGVLPADSTAPPHYLLSEDPIHWWADRVFGEPGDLAHGPLASLWPATTAPFSFVLDGKGSESLLGSWKRTTEKHERQDRIQYIATWLDTKTGLKVTATAAAFDDFPAVEWLLRFENTGTKDSPILENVQALDIVLGTENRQAVVLDQIRGDDCSPQSFLPVERPLKTGTRFPWPRSAAARRTPPFPSSILTAATRASLSPSAGQANGRPRSTARRTARSACKAAWS